MLSLHARAVERFPALVRWKAAGPDRRISLDVVGTRGISETRPETFLLPPWRHAKLEDVPEFELYLSIGRRHAGSVVLSSAADGGLLVYAGEAFPEAKDHTWHPKSPDYAILRRLTA
jgi:hypothetical protein